MRKKVIVTGSSRRLGLYLCESFLKDNWQVFAVSRKATPELLELGQQGLRFFEVEDYTQRHVESLVAELVNSGETFSALVHNASIFERDDEHELDAVDFYQRLFEIHMAFPAQLNRGLENHFIHKPAPASIVHITDIFSENPSAEHILYCSTKAGLENLTKGFAKKFAPRVRVNSVQPGPIKFLPEHSAEQQKQVLSQTLLQNEGGFLPIYKAVLGLIDNDYITGTSIKVDGGRALGRG